MKELTSAYILHTRHYRETSLLIDFFTEQYGRLSVVARGARGRNRKSTFQPFTELLIGVAGSSDLKMLSYCEPKSGALLIAGGKMFFGMYINELLTRVLGRYDPMTTLYRSYAQLLHSLSLEEEDSEISLRRFEFDLLSELGYGVVFEYEVVSGERIFSDQWYHYEPDTGFIRTITRGNARQVFSGEQLLAISRGDFTLRSTKLAAKHITRQALLPLLGGKPLNSRELFSARRQPTND